MGQRCELVTLLYPDNNLVENVGAGKMNIWKIRAMTPVQFYIMML
jgi:hypothetical protein